MKKSLLFLLIPLTITGLTGCVKYNGKNKDGSPKGSTSTSTTAAPTTDTSSSTSEQPPVPPAPTGSVNLYLVLGPNGRYEGAAGDTYATKYLVNTKVVTISIGAALPGKDKVTSTVSGSSFSHWIDRSTSKTLTTAPEVDGSVLVAVYDGGDGGNTPTPSSGLPTEGYGFLFSTPPGSDPYYKVAQYVGKWYDGSGNEYTQYHIDDFELLKDQQFCLYDFGTQAGWTINLDGWSFGGTSESDTKWTDYLSKTSSAYTVKKTFTAKDIYIKLRYEHDNLYMDEKKQVL